MRTSRPAFLACLVLLVLTGCVDRLLVVESTPAGADLFLDDEAVGKTPARIPFEFYGSRELLLRMEGRKTQLRLITLTPPWWQIFPLDFFTELLVPTTFTDTHIARFQLEKTSALDPQGLEALRIRAESFRDSIDSP